MLVAGGDSGRRITSMTAEQTLLNTIDVQRPDSTIAPIEASSVAT